LSGAKSGGVALGAALFHGQEARMAMRWFGRQAPRDVGNAPPRAVGEVEEMPVPVAAVAAVPEVKASAAGRVAAAAQLAGRALWGGRDTGGLTRSGFLGNPVGF